VYRLVARHRGQEIVFQIPEDRDVSLGSHVENDLVLPIRGVSRRHAIIRRCHGGIQFIDCDSSNRFYIEGRQVKSAILTSGLRIQVGEAWLELQEITSTEDDPLTKVLELSTGVLDIASKATSDVVGVQSSQVTHADVLGIVNYMELFGVGSLGQRAELLARIRVALGAEALLTYKHTQRGRKLKISIVESDGAELLREDIVATEEIIRMMSAQPSAETNLKRSGTLVLARRGILSLVAKFSDIELADEDWRKVFIRLLAERLLAPSMAINDYKDSAIRHTLELTGGNQTETARLLGIDRQTVINRSGRKR
jgi:pSer/pThr/pTyr-binding forkhead associated (FHA) protein